MLFLEDYLAISRLNHGLSVEYSNLAGAGVETVQPLFLQPHRRAIEHHPQIVVLENLSYFYGRPTAEKLCPRIRETRRYQSNRTVVADSEEYARREQQLCPAPAGLNDLARLYLDGTNRARAHRLPADVHLPFYV